jgi:hypothetical protein
VEFQQQSTSHSPVMESRLTISHKELKVLQLR